MLSVAKQIIKATTD